MFISFCVSAVPHVMPWEVAAMCNIDTGPNMGREGLDVNVEVYMKYLEMLFSQTTPTHTTQLFNTNELLQCSVSIALLATPTDDVMDREGRPL